MITASKSGTPPRLAPLSKLDLQSGFSSYFGPLMAKGKTEKRLLNMSIKYRVNYKHSRELDLEKRLSLFFFRMKVVGKLCRLLGTSAILWASVVILGGLSTSLTFADFWVVVVIIFAGALQILNLMGWQFRMPWRTIPGNKVEKPTFTTHIDPFAQYFRTIHYLLICCGVLVRIGLPIWRLSLQGFCCHDDVTGESACQNFHEIPVLSMNFFYGMVVLEAALSLLLGGYVARQRGRFFYDIRRRRKGILDIGFVKQLYYIVFSMIFEGSMFHGLDLVEFCIQWLHSHYYEEVLYAAQLLNELFESVECHNKQDPRIADALRRLSTLGMIEKLVDLLSLNSGHEKELVDEIASILYCLIVHSNVGSKFVAVPGALDALMSLVIPSSENFIVGGTDSGKAFSEMLHLRVTDLKILRYLCTTHSSSLEFGKMRGLLPALVCYIEVDFGALQSSDKDRWAGIETSIEVLHCLVVYKSSWGRALRQQISGIVLLKSLRDVIKDCNQKPYLQLLSMKMLHHLALEEEVRCSIGSMGSVIRLLFNLFRQNDIKPGSKEHEENHAPNSSQSEVPEDSSQDRMDAIKMSGELLSRLMVQNKDNYLTLLKLKDRCGNKLSVVDIMIVSLGHREVSIVASAAEILRRLLEYADDSTRIEIAERSAPIVLQYISNCSATNTKSLMYEVKLGLASRAMKFILKKYGELLSESIPLSIRDQLTEQLVRNLKQGPPTRTFSKIRRYSLEVITELINRDKSFIDIFTRHRLSEKLEDALESITEVENFILVSELVGYSRHTEDRRDLVLRCITDVNSSFSSTVTSPHLAEAEVAS